MDLLVIPDGDGDGVGLAEEQVVVLVPLGVQRVLARLCGVGLTCAVHRHSDKGIRQSEQVSLGQVPRAQHRHTNLDLTGASATHHQQ